MNILERIKIGCLIGLGKDNGWLGKRTICREFRSEDGSPSYHQKEWALMVYSENSDVLWDRVYSRV